MQVILLTFQKKSLFLYYLKTSLFRNSQ